MSVTVVRICSVLPAGAGPWTSKVAIPAGVYRASLSCKSNLTAANTTVAIAPYIDAAQTQAAPAYQIESDSAAYSGTMPLASGAAGKTARLVPGISGTAVPMGDPVLQIVNGALITVTKGGSVSGETFELDLILSQMRDAIAPSGVSAAVLA